MNDNRTGNSAHRSLRFGPWATTLDTTPGARLSTFWQRRMAMLATVNDSSSRVSWTLRSVLAAGAVAVMALPLVYFSRTAGLLAQQAQASDKEPAAEFLPLPSESEKRILAALKEPTEMDFTETPLREVVSQLQDRHKIPIQLDHAALRDVGVDPDQTITCKVKDIRLESALNLLLRDLDLTYLTKDEVLLITTEDRAESELLTRVYPVGDLVGDNDYQSLIEIFRTNVKPVTWDKVGGPGTLLTIPQAKSIVVSQTRDVHDEVLQLLRALRAARDASGASTPAIK